MDSVTQAVLGAVVADACLGSKLGRKAAWWGLALGTLPDLDVLARPLMDETAFLTWHRGWSHGILAMILGPILIAWLVKKIHGSKEISWRLAYTSCFLIWSTHVLIDCFTVYGTGLFEPFSRDWVEMGLLFIIDPLYTLPLLIATFAALLFSAHRPWRKWCTWIGLGLSTLYVGWACIAKSVINERFAENIKAAGMSAERWQTAPSVANTFLWRCIVQGEQGNERGYWVGYASLWDESDAVYWRWLPARHHLIDDSRQTPAVDTIQWFSMGYWIAREDERGLAIADIRFGETSMSIAEIEGVEQPWIFNWRLNEDATDFYQDDITYPNGFQFTMLWDRIWGKRFPWEVPQ